MRYLMGLLIALYLAGCSNSGEKETEVSLEDVPRVVLDSARKAVPGITIDAAEIEEEDGEQVYELSGEADGKSYEIEVSPSGEVLEVEED
jgi:uncharacterized membrane protein YkoI